MAFLFYPITYLIPLLPPRRRHRLCFARLARLIQGLNSSSVALLVSMVVSLGHRHRLMAGEVVDLLPWLLESAVPVIFITVFAEIGCDFQCKL